jgi:hypothetical protein
MSTWIPLEPRVVPFVHQTFDHTQSDAERCDKESGNMEGGNENFERGAKQHFNMWMTALSRYSFGNRWTGTQQCVDHHSICRSADPDT